MGFLDKLRNSSSDKREEEYDEQENAKPSRQKLTREKPERTSSSHEDSTGKFSLSYLKNLAKKVEKDSYEEEDKKEIEPVREKKAKKDSSEISTESAFAIDEGQDFFAKQQAKFDEELKGYDDLPELSVKEKRIQDVLEVLEIPSTFDIESDIFLPEDIQKVSFDLQTPYGFEQGQVNAFISQTKITINRYVELLTLRNQHIAQLASMVDKLQVNINNLRFQNEISNGINIMPTSETDDLENRHMEALLTIKKLEDKLNSVQLEKEISHETNQLSENERQKFDDLQDQLSISNREKATLEEEIYSLKNRLAYLEEMVDDDDALKTHHSDDSHDVLTVDDFETGNDDNYDSSMIEELPAELDEYYEDELNVLPKILPSHNNAPLPSDDIDNDAFFSMKQEDKEFPLVGLDEEPLLPELIEEPVQNSVPKPPKNSAFSIFEEDEEESLFEPVSLDKTKQMFEQSTMVYEEEDEENDELGKLMEDWKNSDK